MRSFSPPLVRVWCVSGACLGPETSTLGLLERPVETWLALLWLGMLSWRCRGCQHSRVDCGNAPVTLVLTGSQTRRGTTGLAP